ncbi:2-hydroxyacyl-CoA dehydratase subunit D [Peptostreptococcus equinus]|uniref:2-hydroxyacyl-CoA dehydratase family protein n=1 Tax=Peptostreptococcus equinus TaxID=3003601 RepID=A0ABY7JNJ9_9FIRM|nr:2-hydroxyacyl-CoA dehydratase family protein [Peptostreptococcus sp. CBA3647]WAW14675.1 2-hydroxyacyl-CoA dehydratase family protein [Peptostreptococcus sp. CBA3647]
MTLNDIISKLEHVSNNPKEMMKDYLNAGEKVVGCLPVYTPEEIIHAAGMVPMAIWGGNTEIEKAKQYFPAFACSIMQSTLEFGLKGSYDGLSAVIIPGMCDTLITMSQIWKSGVKIPMIGLTYPQSRKIQAGVDFLADEYTDIKKKMEDICGHEITEESLLNSIDIYNEHRKVMQEFVEIVPNYLNTFTPYYRNVVIKSGHFMKKEEHTKLVKELIEALKEMPKEDFKGKKVVTSGIILDDKEVLKALEENNIAIVYDNIAQETRQFRTLVPEGSNAIERLAKQWSEIEGCSLAYDPKKLRGKMVLEDAKKHGAEGVIYALMKFCDPEEYDYPLFKKDMEDAGMPHLYIEIEQGTTSIEQIRTRIQTFAEILA